MTSREQLGQQLRAVLQYRQPLQTPPGYSCLQYKVRASHRQGYGGLGSLTWKMVLSRGLPEPASLPTSLAHMFTSKTSATAKANRELWRSKDVSSSPRSLQPTPSAWAGPRQCFRVCFPCLLASSQQRCLQHLPGQQIWRSAAGCPAGA